MIKKITNFFLIAYFVVASAFAGVTYTTSTPPTNSVSTTTIQNDAITEPKIASDNAPADEYCLTYEGTTGNFEWQACAGSSFTPPVSVEDSTADGTLVTVNSTTFTMRFTPTGDIAVSVNGVHQPPNESSYVGTTLTLSTAVNITTPPLDVVDVVYLK